MTAPELPANLPAPPSRFNRRLIWLAIALVAIAGSLYQATSGRAGAALLNAGGLAQFVEFWAAALTPDLSRTFLDTIARATLVTFAYAVCGTSLSLGLGAIAGVLTAASWWRTVLPTAARGRWRAAPLWGAMRALLAVPRAIHELLWGLFFLNILGLDPLVAVLAIAVPFGAIVAQVFADILDETPQDPLNALLASGTPPLSAWIYGLLPQALPNLLSYATYRFECSLRAAAVLGIIGAGGLGYEILLSLQSLRYHQLWTGFYALILLNGAVDLWSGWLRRRLGLTSRLALKRSNRARATASDRQPADRDNPWGLRLSWLGIGTSIPLCFWGLGLDWSRLGSERARLLLADLATAAVPTRPSLAALRELLHLSHTTVAMSILAIALAGSASIAISFPAAQTFLLPGGWLQAADRGPRAQVLLAWSLFAISRLVLLISRAIPAPIWALVFLFVFFPGILPGALALAVHNFGILGRLLAEANENLDDRPLRSLQALGAAPGPAILYSILPQNLGQFLAYILYRWEVCMRETAIVGLVGAGGLGRQLAEQMSSFAYGDLLITLGCFVLLTWLIDTISQQLRADWR